MKNVNTLCDEMQKLMLPFITRRRKKKENKKKKNLYMTWILCGVISQVLLGMNKEYVLFT